MKTSINLFNMERWFPNEFIGFVEPVRVAEELGVDIMVIAEHLAMSDDMEQFERRYGKAPVNPKSPFMEPMVFLGYLAQVTKKIKLGTCIMLSPLRPALVVAKQIATLDYLSGGRAYIGLGAGWQKEEFDAADMPWKGRYDHLIEQVKAARELWSNAPAAFAGEFVNFSDLNCLPFPPQGRDLTVLLGILGTDRNLQRIVDCGAGWVPMERDPAKLVEPIKKLKALAKADGQDPDKLEILIMSDVVMDAGGKPDLDRTLALIPQYAEIGVTTLQYAPAGFCSDFKALPKVLEKIERAMKG